MKMYGPTLEALGEAIPLDEALILVHVNSSYIDELLQTHRSETVAGHIRHAAASGLTELACGSPQALRLIVEYGQIGERALKQARPEAADVVFGDYSDAAPRRQAVRALAEHGSMALAMLDKYSADPDFQEILRMHGPAVIPPIARTDAGPETLAHPERKNKRSFTEALALAALFALRRQRSGDDPDDQARRPRARGPSSTKPPFSTTSSCRCTTCFISATSWPGAFARRPEKPPGRSSTAAL